MSQTATTDHPLPDLPRKGGMARNSVNLVIGQAATTALAIALNAAVGRLLGPSDFGVLYLVTSIAAFAYVFVDWGHGSYVVREIARRPERAGELMGTVLVVRGVTAAALTGPAVLTARLFGYDGRTQLGVALIMAAWLPMYLGLSYSWVFRGIERMEFDALINVVLKFLSLLAGITILAAGGRIFGVIASTAIAGSITLVVGTTIYRRLALPRLRLSSGMARELIVGGAPMMTMTVAIAIQSYIDANMLSRLTPPSVVGWYGAATTFTNTLIAPAFVLASAAYPRLAMTAGDLPRFRKTLDDALRSLLFVAVLGGVGTYLFADVAVAIVYSTRQFGPSADILRAFSPAIVLVFVDMLLGTAILCAGSPVSLAGTKLLAVAVVTGLELILIPLFQARSGNGGIGVTLSFAAGELVMVAGAIRLLPRGALETRLTLDVLRAAAAGAVTVAIVRWLGNVSPMIAIPLSVVVFTIIAFVVRLVTRADVSAIAGLLPGRSSALN